MFVNYKALRAALRHTAHCAGQVPLGYKRNAVCLLLLDRAETMVLLIQKADNVGYRWRDHIALPGGRVDARDHSAKDAALREVYEELRIDRSNVDVLGGLGHFQTRGSDNDLEVIVARGIQRSAMCVDHREIARALEFPLEDLVQLHLRAGFRSRPSPEIGDALIYPLSDVRIWGVTARILHQFLELVLDCGILVCD